MRIAYMTTDEVNQALAAKLAAKCGAVICALLPKDSLPEGQFHAVLNDLDAVEKHRRGEVVAQILRSPSTCPRAVHGYGITDEQTKDLRRHGIAVGQRLRLGLIRALCKAAQPSRATVPTDGGLTDLTWVTLVS
jgi:hypothetical protein